MISALFSRIWLYLAAAGAGMAALVAAYLKISSDATAKERAKAAKRTIAAKEEQLEMHREATAAERQAAAMTEAKAREEAMKWAKR